MAALKPLFDDVRQDPALRWFGAALAAINALTAVFWLTVQPIARILDRDTEPICWPFLDQCARFRIWNESTLTGIVAAMGVAALLNAALFAHRRLCGHGCVLLGILTIAKSLLVLQDYRLVLNQHYMSVAITAAFLIVPSRRSAAKWTIVSFYVWAGTLKLNQDWLSGMALGGQRPLGVPDWGLPYACAYVVVLELALVWGLLSKRPTLFWMTFAQFVLFHLTSFGVVGYFYPLLMFLILSIFALDRVVPAPGEPQAARTSIRAFLSRREHPLLYGYVGVFAAVQMVPQLLSTDPALTGEGRMFALNMFDAPLRCIATITRHRPGFDDATRTLRVPYLQPRIACDPIVYFQVAKNTCRALVGDPSIELDLRLRTWRAAAQQAVPTDVIDLRSVCKSKAQYFLFRHNTWIHAAGAAQ